MARIGVMQKDWATAGCRVFRPVPGKRKGASVGSLLLFVRRVAVGFRKGRLGWELVVVRPAGCVWSVVWPGSGMATAHGPTPNGTRRTNESRLPTGAPVTTTERDPPDGLEWAPNRGASFRFGATSDISWHGLLTI